MSAEVVLAPATPRLLLIGAFGLEWLSAHTHRRSLRYRTAGFTYDPAQDHWACPEGEHLWPHEFDHERRLVRYRAKAHICNRCPRKGSCTDSDRGREIVRPLDPWPHSEAGRFHRTISLVMIALAALILVVEAARHHEPPEAALLIGLVIVPRRSPPAGSCATSATTPPTSPTRFPRTASASWQPAPTDDGRAARDGCLPECTTEIPVAAKRCPNCTATIAAAA